MATGWRQPGGAKLAVCLANNVRRRYGEEQRFAVDRCLVGHRPSHDAAKLTIIAVLVALGTAGMTGSAGALPLCTRAQNELNICEVVPVLSNDWFCEIGPNLDGCTQAEEDDGSCNDPSNAPYSNKYPWVDVLKYRQQLYNDPPRDVNNEADARESLLTACEKFFAIVPIGVDNGADLIYTGAMDVEMDFTPAPPPYDYGACVLVDLNEAECDVAFNLSWDSATGECWGGRAVHVNSGIQPDAVCDRVPNPMTAPYFGIIGGSSRPGAAFKDEFQRSRILHANSKQLTEWLGQSTLVRELWSDAGAWRGFPDASGTGAGLDFYKLLTNPKPQRVKYVPQLAEIDHVIPAKDSHGCGCGNSRGGNALVISSRLNGDMSNNVRHPVRRQLLEEYTLPP